MEVANSPAGDSREWKDILARFRQLGGEFINLEIRTGKRGRGLFVADPSLKPLVLCPRHLLVPRELLVLQDGRLQIQPDPSLNEDARVFAESYYQYFSYGESGEQEASGFLSGLGMLPEAAKSALRKQCIIKTRERELPTPTDVLERFLDTRAVSYFGKSVLAPIWELTNHDSFSHSFTVTEQGIGSPRPIADEHELTFRYNNCRSPLAQWSHYGFASQELYSYAFPFTVQLKDCAAVIKCKGGQGQKLNSNKIYDDDSRITVVVESLPIGCTSSLLPEAYLKKILIKAGSERPAASILNYLQEVNIQDRRRIIEMIQHEDSYTAESLRTALSEEIRLIENSTAK